FGRLILSLSIVIGLMWAVSVVLRKRGFGGTTTRRPQQGMQVELLARKSMGRNVSIAVVRVADQAMVVGITDHQVTTLAHTEIDDAEYALADAEVNGTNGASTNGNGNTSQPGRQRTALPPGPQGTTTTWKAMLDHMRERTVRH